MNRIHCAIYTRKSSDEGLEQEFNSLDAQREACAAYIASQKHEGWVCLPHHYDDGGISGGTMDRPALRQLIADIQSGRIQTVVVYKVDRLTRSLSDFAKIVDVLDTAGASFVSVTQQFNTTTSMGRLTLNMLLSFAQFEREIAGERIRDKIAASKAKGMWMGGNVPLGYDAIDRKLVINESEAETVRDIFDSYSRLGSVRSLKTDLDRRGIVTKRRKGASGFLGGGKPFSRGALYNLLQNRIYAGQIAHRGEIFDGQHDRIVPVDLWEKVQAILASNRNDHRTGSPASEPSLLAGLIVDGSGEAMMASHATKGNKRYRYYVSRSLIVIGDGDRNGASNISATRVPAGEIEARVIAMVSELLGSESQLTDNLASLPMDARQMERVMMISQRFAADGWRAVGKSVGEALRDTIHRVEIKADAIVCVLDRARVASLLLGETVAVPASEPIELTVAASLQRAGKGKRVIVEGRGPGVDPALIALMRNAFQLRRAMCEDDGEQPSSGDDPWTSTYRARRIALLRLSYLSPRIIACIVKGQQPAGLSAKLLMALSRELPIAWDQQAQHLGMPSELQ